MQHIATQFQKPEGACGVALASLMHVANAGDYAAALAMLHPVRGERLLEIGMGCGLHVPDILARGIAYHGIDRSPDMVVAAQHNAPGAVFTCGDVCGAELPSADCGLAVNTMQWWGAPRSALARLRATVGRLVVALPAPPPEGAIPDFGQRYFSAETLERLLVAAGFDAVHVAEVPTPRRPYLIAGAA